MGKPVIPVARAIQAALAVSLAVVIGLAVISARGIGGQPDTQEASLAFDAEAPGSSVLSVVETKPVSEISTPESRTSPIARNVGGGLIAAPVDITGPLERLDPLPQPTPPPKPQPVEPFKPKNFTRWKLVFNSVIPAAGVFDLNGSTMVLPDIDVVAANETCIAPNGVEWPCGMAARTAFRNFVKGRAITCQVPDVPPQQAYIADCRLQGRDMAAWLVEQGWTRAKPSTPLVRHEAMAKQSGRGIHGNPPPGIQIVRAGAEPGDTR